MGGECRLHLSSLLHDDSDPTSFKEAMASIRDQWLAAMKEEWGALLDNNSTFDFPIDNLGWDPPTE
jgi:hypothetical protein